MRIHIQYIGWTFWWLFIEFCRLCGADPAQAATITRNSSHMENIYDDPQMAGLHSGIQNVLTNLANKLTGNFSILKENLAHKRNTKIK
jgi:hypothetical protein